MMRTWARGCICPTNLPPPYWALTATKASTKERASENFMMGVVVEWWWVNGLGYKGIAWRGHRLLPCSCGKNRTKSIMKNHESSALVAKVN